MRVVGYLHQTELPNLWLKKRQHRPVVLQYAPLTFSRSLLPSLSPQRNRSKPRLAVHSEGAVRLRAGTETWVLFCTSLRQHWAVGPPRQPRHHSVVKPCSSSGARWTSGLACGFAESTSSVLLHLTSWHNQPIYLPQGPWQSLFHKEVQFLVAICLHCEAIFQTVKHGS